MERGFHKPGDVENGLGYYLGKKLGDRRDVGKKLGDRRDVHLIFFPRKSGNVPSVPSFLLLHLSEV